MKYEPCAPSDPEGEKKNFMDLTGDLLKLPDVDIVKNKIKTRNFMFFFLKRMILMQFYPNANRQFQLKT